MTQAIILAGGLGTRLRPVVADTPKPMAPIRGRPFLALLLDHLASGGIEEVILSVGYRHEAVSSYFGDRYQTIALDYAIEQSPLGTGGALRQALALARTNPVLCLNGDTLLGVDYGDMEKLHRSNKALVTLALKPVPDVSRYGRVILEQDRVVAFEEKGGSGAGFINGGVYILDKDIFDGFDVPAPFSFERDFLPSCCAAHSVQPYLTDTYFIDIGTPDDYRRADQELSPR